MIEVIAATALLMVTVAGFMTMAAANSGELVKEHRLDQSNYELTSKAAEGDGEATGRTLVVRFFVPESLLGEEGPDSLDETFRQYQVSGEDTGNTMTYYWHE